MRDYGELHVLWRSVEMVERNRNISGTLAEAPIAGRNPNDYNRAFARVSPDLKNFVRFGKSSLTPYEATRLAQGLGVEGQLHIEPLEAARPYGRGDRLEVTIRSPGANSVTTRAIALTNGGILAIHPQTSRYQVYFPEYDNGKDGHAKITVGRVLSSALKDGKRWE